VKGSEGFFEATGNEFVSKINKNQPNIRVDDPSSVQDENTGPPVEVFLKLLAMNLSLKLIRTSQISG
jgi:hypothetical protein